MLKKILMVSAVSLLAISNVYAAPTPEKIEFKQQLQHANFMPNLMPKLMQGYRKGGNPLQLTEDQFKQLQAFHQKNSPKMKQMVKKVSELEAQARKMALENLPPQEIEKIGQESLHLRANIMQGKLGCRSFVRSVLNPQQYKKLLTSY